MVSLHSLYPLLLLHVLSLCLVNCLHKIYEEFTGIPFMKIGMAECTILKVVINWVREKSQKKKNSSINTPFIRIDIGTLVYAIYDWAVNSFVKCKQTCDNILLSCTLASSLVSMSVIHDAMWPNLFLMLSVLFVPHFGNYQDCRPNYRIEFIVFILMCFVKQKTL